MEAVVVASLELVMDLVLSRQVFMSWTARSLLAQALWHRISEAMEQQEELEGQAMDHRKSSGMSSSSAMSPQ